MIDKAILIAAKAHEGQVDKAGQPYILHPLRVMLSCVEETDRICAVLHDVIEDTQITLDCLRRQGFSEEVLSALNALTKKQGEGYEEFISRVINNKIACRVKLSDLTDNMDLSRIEAPSLEDLERVKKYRKASEAILRVLHEENESGPDKFINVEVNGKISIPKGCIGKDFENKFRVLLERNHWYFEGEIR